MELRKLPNEDKIRDLNLRATELKKTDIATAVNCLEEAHQMARRQGSVGRYGIDWWLRLPVYLQHAGRIEDAEREIARIEADVKAGHHGAADVRLHMMKRVSDKHGLILQRERKRKAATT